ncbi:Eco57I restriction-modification methylase domain-containing protein [Sedimentimonas flavescens]|uniref:Eco57I restriction-modification methylase domain-containing protein n=1 Tax=Sedimentimonas flavescens TaxID=2851012 RepID=UPI0021A558CA|nr:N-6 DNA methylase [Sedimentimonas flavescens]MCT2538576.1 N-6 DNA methylase [Sedimentimonas flavescens]
MSLDEDSESGGQTSPERAYLQASTKAHRRRFAQVLTPPDCAAAMADWVGGRDPKTLLDPAFGTGILARAVVARLPRIAVTGYELDAQIAAAGRSACAGMNLTLHEASFFEAPLDERFDAIIANPPFLRPGAGTALRAQVRATAEHFGIALSGLTNAYVLFLFEALARLAPGGRAAFLLPAEWANANTSGPLKEHLVRGGYLREIIQFCAYRPVFEKTLTTASLVLLEAPAHVEPIPAEIRATFVPADARLPSRAGPLPPGVTQRWVTPEALLAAPKWDELIRDDEAPIPPGFVPLSALATTRRGIATGANGFFHLSRERATEIGLRASQCLPCVAKSADVPSLIFGPAEFKSLIRAGRPTQFFAPTKSLTEAEASYVAQGEAEGLHNRFLTRNRRPWYAPERLYRAPIWAATFGRGQMRFILNTAEVWQLTAFHGIFPLQDDPARAKALVACLNSAPVQALMRGRMRIYARGLQKVEPRDLLEIPVPDLRAVSAAWIAALGAALEALNDGKSGADDALTRLVMEAAQDAASGGASDETVALG